MNPLGNGLADVLASHFNTDGSRKISALDSDPQLKGFLQKIAVGLDPFSYGLTLIRISRSFKGKIRCTSLHLLAKGSGFGIKILKSFHGFNQFYFYYSG